MTMYAEELKTGIFLVTNTMFVYSYYLIFREIFGGHGSHKRRVALCYMAFYLINSGMYLMKIPPMITLAGFIAMVSACLVCCYPGRWKRKLLVGVIVISYSFLIEMASGYLVAAFFKDALGSVLSRAHHETIIIVISKILMLLSAITLSLGKRSYHIERKPPHYIGMLLLVPVCSVLLVICIFMGDREQNRETVNYIILAGVLLVFLLNMGVYYLISRICSAYDREMSYQELERQLQLYSENSQIQKQFIIEMERYRHDVKNLYICLSGYLKEGRWEKAQEALQREMGVIRKINSIIDTGNPELDYLMNHKVSYASSKGVEVTASFQLVEPVRIEVSDLYNLLGNILDNAIEAVEAMEEAYPVEFNLESRKGVLYTCAKNHFTGERKKNEAGFLSTKRDGKRHGYGLKTIESITEKYDGFMKIETSKTEFKLEAILYYKM